MEPSKLFELAVNLTIADINAGVIAPATMGRDDQIEDRITQHLAMLRRQWQVLHNEDNIDRIY
jgi:adenosyl cobinamide kinase/adenosyl cobinamide phosphate guanylyltransferase